VEFEWDEAKHRRNLAERGLGFDYASQVLEGGRIEWADQRKEYGEIRTCALGQVGTDILLVVYTMRGETRRIISARPANRKERSRWLSRE
jgi:uncharacterized protein